MYEMRGFQSKLLGIMVGLGGEQPCQFRCFVEFWLGVYIEGLGNKRFKQRDSAFCLDMVGIFFYISESGVAAEFAVDPCGQHSWKILFAGKRGMEYCYGFPRELRLQ